MALPYLNVSLRSVSYDVSAPRGSNRPAASEEPERLHARCRLVDADGAPLENAWRKGDVVAVSELRVSSPSAERKDSDTVSSFQFSYSHNSRALDLSAGFLNTLANASLLVEVFTDSPSSDDVADFGSVRVAIAPFLTNKRLHGLDHAVPLAKAANVKFQGTTVTLQLNLSNALWTSCRRGKTLCLQQLMFQNLPEAWSEGDLAATTLFDVKLQIPLLGTRSASPTDDDVDTSAAHASSRSVVLPRTKLIDGTLTWRGVESSSDGVDPVCLGFAEDDHIPLRWVYFDKAAVTQLRAAAQNGQALTVSLERLVPDKKKKAVLNPDSASACTATFSLDGSGDAQDSLLDDGATAIAAAVPLQPNAGPGDAARPHPVTAAQSAVFLAMKLSSPLSAARGSRVVGELRVADILGQTVDTPSEKKFSSVHESEEVIRSYLRETVRVLLAEHTVQFSSGGSEGKSGSELPSLDEQRQQVRRGLKDNGLGPLLSSNLKYAVVGLLRERFRADQLKLDNARQSSTVLINLCAFLEKEVEAAIAAASGDAVQSRGSTRGGRSLNPLLILAYDAEVDGQVSRALRFHHQHTSAVAAEADAAPSVQAAAWAELGRCHIRAGSLVEGSIAVQEALTRNPSSVPAAATFAALLLQRQLGASAKDASSSNFARAMAVLAAAMVTPPSSSNDAGANLADHLYRLAQLIAAHLQGQDPSSTDTGEVANHIIATSFALDLRLTKFAQAALDALEPLVNNVPATVDGDALRLTVQAYNMAAAYQRGEDDKVIELSSKFLENVRGPTSQTPEEAKTANFESLDVGSEEQTTARAESLAVEDACFWRVLAEALSRQGNALDALTAYDRSLACVDETFNWDSGGVPSRIRILLAAGDLCADEDSINDRTRAQEYYTKAATLGACPSVWFKLGCNCAALGQVEEAEDAFTKVTAMDNTHALVWAELAKLSLIVDPVRLSDARQYADQAFAHRIDSRAALHGLADAFLATGNSAPNSQSNLGAGAAASARAYAERCLRQSLALGEDKSVRARLASLLTNTDEREACEMFLSPRRGPAIE
eukprot:INCI471.1.p1 GENE.INCI471.1~~INCI471.1.p1  ORF type:complete len:1056 (+),score=227.04 INCI471.1:262-3429(+)